MGISFCLEGSEGAGKSTLKAIAEILLKETTDFPVLSTREPGGTDLGEAVRSILKSDLSRNVHPVANMLLYSAARAELCFKVEKPFLEKNEFGVLLKDRSWLSTESLQMVDGVGLDYIKEVNAPFTGVPDKFVIIDIPVPETVVRMESVFRYSSEREIDWRDKQTQENLHKIRRNYLDFAIRNRDRVLLLDCFDDPWDKAARIKFEIVKSFALRNPETVVGKNLMHTSISILHEARKIGRIYATKEGGKYGVFNIDEYRQKVEATRIDLNYPSKVELQTQMHREWIQLGLEGARSGIERGK